MTLNDVMVLACLQQHLPFLDKDLSSLISMGSLKEILGLLGMREYFMMIATILPGFMLDTMGILVITWMNLKLLK